MEEEFKVGDKRFLSSSSSSSWKYFFWFLADQLRVISEKGKYVIRKEIDRSFLLFLETIPCFYRYLILIAILGRHRRGTSGIF